MENINQIIKIWESNTHSYDQREQLFDKLMSIYNYGYLKHPSYVKQILLTQWDLINNRTKLVIKNQLIIDSDKVLESLMLRYPVYFGEPMTNYYNSMKVKDCLNYNCTNLPTHHLKYAIVGPVFTSKSIQKFNVIHVWGINLESRNTNDYPIYVNNNNLNVGLYNNAIKDLFDLIYQSALSTTKNNQLIHIRIPLIGLGAYLNSCPSTDKNLALSIFLNTLVSQLKYSNIKVYLCIYDTFITNDLIFKQWYNTQYQTKAGQLIIDRNLFDVSMFNMTDNLFLVNAWDNKSFIGNGGSLDNTIDGYLISANGPGNMIPNSSYLHNPFICTSLLSPKNWILI